MGMGPQRYLGAFRRLGHAVAGADDIRGSDNHTGPAHGLYKREGMADGGGDTAVLRHRLHLRRGKDIRRPLRLRLHNRPIPHQRGRRRRRDGRASGPAAHKRGGEDRRENNNPAAAVRQRDDTHRHHPYRPVPNHQETGRSGERGPPDRPPAPGGGAGDTPGGLGGPLLHRCAFRALYTHGVRRQRLQRPVTAGGAQEKAKAQREAG